MKPNKHSKHRTKKNSRPGSDEHVLTGIHSVRECLRAGRRKIEAISIKVGMRDSSMLKEIEEEARNKQVPCTWVKEDLWRKNFSTDASQGVVAQVGSYPYFEPDPSHWEPKVLLVLDQVQDPHNLGAMIRTAYGLGWDAVVLPKDRSVLVTPTVSKISAGAAEHMKVILVTNLSRYLDQLKQDGFWLVGTSMQSQNAPHEIPGFPLALVLGAEGKGIRQKIGEKLDCSLQIPMKSDLDSLNVSVAAGIFMYEINKIRG